MHSFKAKTRAKIRLAGPDKHLRSPIRPKKIRKRFEKIDKSDKKIVPLPQK